MSVRLWKNKDGDTNEVSHGSYVEAIRFLRHVSHAKLYISGQVRNLVGSYRVEPKELDDQIACIADRIDDIFYELKTEAEETIRNFEMQEDL